MARDFWERQAEIMSKPGRAASSQTAGSKPGAAQQEPPAEAHGPGPAVITLSHDARLEEELASKRESLAKIEQWIREADTLHPRWEEGVKRYGELYQEVKALQAELDGPLAYLRRPGDDYQGVVIFPADTSIPQIDGHWQRLPDGRIEARVSLFELSVMAEMARIIGVL